MHVFAAIVDAHRRQAMASIAWLGAARLCCLPWTALGCVPCSWIQSVSLGRRGRTTTTSRRRPGNQAPSSKRQPTRPAATRFRSDTRLDWPRPARHRHRVLACRAEQSRVQCAGQSSEREQAAGGACTHLVSRRGCTHVVAHGRLFFLFGRLLSSSPAMAKCAQHHAQDGVESGGAGDSRGNTAAPSHCAASASASVCCCCCCLLPALSSRFGVFPART